MLESVNEDSIIIIFAGFTLPAFPASLQVTATEIESPVIVTSSFVSNLNSNPLAFFRVLTIVPAGITTFPVFEGLENVTSPVEKVASGLANESPK